MRYVGQEFTLQVPVALDQLKSGDRKGIRAPFDELTSTATATIRRTSRSRWSTCGSGHRQAGEAELPVPRRRRRSDARRGAQVYFRCRTPRHVPVYARDTLARRHRRSQAPRLIQEHGTTTVLFDGDLRACAESGELVINVGGAA